MFGHLSRAQLITTEPEAACLQRRLCLQRGAADGHQHQGLILLWDCFITPVERLTSAHADSVLSKAVALHKYARMPARPQSVAY